MIAVKRNYFDGLKLKKNVIPQNLFNGRNCMIWLPKKFEFHKFNVFNLHTGCYRTNDTIGHVVILRAKISGKKEITKRNSFFSLEVYK